MRGVLVSLDLETTGLDVQNDSIIEIGAVRMRDGEIIDEFSTLINPGFVIPMETTHITGIHQDDLRGAPSLKQVLPDIAAFVGDAPVIAHNAAFDLGFMQRFNVLLDNQPIDTYELASVLLPRVPRYSLSSLVAMAGIDLDQAHRALDDARATGLLYWHLWQRMKRLSPDILYEISRAASSLKWDLAVVFEAALREVQQQESHSSGQPSSPFAPLDREVKPLAINNEPQPLDLEQVVGLIDENGLLARELDHYEYRPQQLEMVRAIMEAFNTHQHLIIEAGTGTGKSLAYLVPAIQWAVRNNTRVVISTNTINLQDQLINKDVPLIRQASGADFAAAVMKGRSNYLCPRRLAAARRRQLGSLDELRTLAKILVWLQESSTGDKGEISLRSGEYASWNRLSAQDEACTMQRCSAVMQGTCPFYKARRQAEAAHVVIVNHALLISDALTENRVLPEYRYLIIDEAHQLEEAITDGLSVRIDQIALIRRLNEIGSPNSGILSEMLETARGHVPDRQLMRLESFIQSIGEAVQEMMVHIRAYFAALAEFASEVNITDQHRLRIDAKRRGQLAFSSVELQWHRLDEFFEVIADALQRVADAVDRLDGSEIPGFGDYVNSLGAAARYLQEARYHLYHFTLEPDANTIYWINVGGSRDFVSVQTAPLHIGPMMDEYVWRSKDAVVLTSATLQTSANFDYIHHRLYAEDIRTLSVGSPFDYKKSTLVYVPDDIPMPNQPGYQKAVERGIIELAAALEGRVMALFTSYAQLRETAGNISLRLALGGITVYDQATGGSREALLDNFKSTEKAVLLGTRSFWQGVDIPGDDLSALVIVRLPFAVPSEPVFAARSESYRNAFMQYAVPDAILRFRQGFGRLIRTQADRGVVAIFDSRVVSKSYGLNFLESLPDCTIEYGPLERLPDLARSWLES